MTDWDDMPADIRKTARAVAEEVCQHAGAIHDTEVERVWLPIAHALMAERLRKGPFSIEYSHG